jgi:DNA-binding HxlR family transcriptional regulator
MLMSEVAKLQPGFHSNLAQQLSRLSAHGIVHRASSDSTVVTSAMGIGTDDSMQDILGSTIEWQLRAGHQQQQRKP